MYILKENGSMVIKVFDTYTAEYFALFTLLKAYFLEVELIKLKTSRPGNNERYVVCKGFIKTEHTIVFLDIMLTQMEKKNFVF